MSSKICTNCGVKNNQFDTWWDKTRQWMFELFHRDIYDVSTEKYTQGISDGYKLGFEQAKKHYENTIKT